MITEQTIYWITRLDSIQWVCEVLYTLSFLFSFIFLLVFVGLLATSCGSNYIKRLSILASISSIFFLGMALIFIIIRCFVPTTKEAIVMYALPKITSNEALQSECKDWYKTTKDFIKNKMETKDK